jgi:DNA-binding SARP family transcriptional activator
MRYRVLGPLDVQDERGGQVVLAAGKQRVVLAVLLLHANRAVSAGRLTEVLWDGHPPRTASQSLLNHVARLRRVLGSVLAQRIETRSPGYAIRIRGPMELDLWQFTDLDEQARKAAADGDWQQAGTCAREALALWRDDPLADVAAPLLLRDELPRLAEARLRMQEAAADADLELGHYDQAAAELAGLARANPLRERLYERWMLALSRAGRRADALVVYQDARRVLRDELGVDPGAGLRELHQRIVAGEPRLSGADFPGGRSSSAGPDPARATASDPGTGLPAPGQQTAGQERVVPEQLPGAIRHFTGRSAELATLTALAREATAASGPVIISAIGGMAGIGKTALAVHWAHQVATKFPDGQLYVNLRGFDPCGPPVTPAQAIRGFLGALAVSAQRVPPDLDQQAALYRSLLARRRMLVLLDNARDAAQVRMLLPGSPGCLVIVTSRNSLASLVAAEGAHPLTLDLLSADEAREMLARRLGTQRAGYDPRAADELIRLCARLPLALSIAAARAATRPGFPLTALVSELRLSGGLDVLDTGEPDTTLRVVFSWSYQNLSAATARVFRLLGLHPGPDISVPAAASLAGVPEDQARRALDELASAHLITEQVPGRFACHDLLRAYAAEQAGLLDKDADRRMAIHRMLDHYLHTATTATMLLTPTRDPIDLTAPQAGAQPEDLTTGSRALAWFEAEHQVLTAVIGRAADDGFDAHAWQLAWGLARFLDLRGYWTAWDDIRQTALDAVRRLGDRAGQAQMHRYSGRALGRAGRYDEARDHHLEALALFRQLDDTAGQGRSLLNIGQDLDRQDQPREALGPLSRALQLFRAAGHRAGQSRALNGLGWCHARLGEHQQALGYLEHALALHRELGDPTGEAATMHSFGYACHQLGRHADASDCYRRSLDLYRELGDLYDQAYVLSYYGDALHSAGDVRAARQAWQQALVILNDLHHPDADQARARLSRLGTS